MELSDSISTRTPLRSSSFAAPKTHSSADLVGTALGLALLLLRLAEQGLAQHWLPVASVVFVIAFGAPRRWTFVGVTASAAVVGLIALPFWLALAGATFVGTGMLLTAGASRSSRLISGFGLLTSGAILLATPRAAIPTAIGAAAVVAALFAGRTPPAALERAIGRTLEPVFPLVDRTRARARRAVAETGVRRALTFSRWRGLLCVAITLVGVLLALRDQRAVLIDDAAITFRYAVRIASGDGFTYNDGDHTNGASAPLYTLVLALGHLLGLDVESAARGIGVACYGAAVGLVTAIVGRTRGVFAAAVAGVVILATVGFRTEALTGMESALAAVLGLLVVLLIVEDRSTWAGVILGLAVVNKLDAGLLAAAVGMAWCVVHRRPPWRLAGVAAATAAPWFVFSQLYFGSVLPHSARQKLSGEVVNEGVAHDPTWMLGHLSANHMTALLFVTTVAVVGLVVRAVRTDQGTTLAIATCTGWAVLHGSAFSLLDLGDPYPWYTTVVYPAVVVAGVSAASVVASDVSRRFGTSTSLRPETVRLIAATPALLLIASLPGLRVTATAASEGHRTTDFERFEEGRRAAGSYVGQHAEPGEVVRTCYGWVAFGAIDQPIDEICPLSTREAVGPPIWIVVSYLPGDQRAQIPADAALVREFRSPVGVTEVHRR